MAPSRLEALGDLPLRIKRLYSTHAVEPYTVVLTDGYTAISCGYPARSNLIMCGQSFQKLPILKKNNRKTEGRKMTFSSPA